MLFFMALSQSDRSRRVINRVISRLCVYAPICVSLLLSLVRWRARARARSLSSIVT